MEQTEQLPVLSGSEKPGLAFVFRAAVVKDTGPVLYVGISGRL